MSKRLTLLLLVLVLVLALAAPVRAQTYPLGPGQHVDVTCPPALVCPQPPACNSCCVTPPTEPPVVIPPTTGLACPPHAFVCEDWEDGDHAGWDWNSATSCGGYLDTCIAGVGGFNSPNALQMRLKKDVPDTAYPGRSTNKSGTPISVDIRGVPVYMRWYAKWSPGYEFMPNYSDGQKHLYFRGWAGGGDREWMTMVGIQRGQNVSTGQLTMSYRGHGNVLFYNGGASERWLTGGRWYCIEALQIGNSAPNKYDGRLAIWVDGKVYMDHRNIYVTAYPDSPARYLPWLSSYYGGNPGPSHPAQSVTYDNIAASHQPIGCIGVPPTP